MSRDEPVTSSPFASTSAELLGLVRAFRRRPRSSLLGIIAKIETVRAVHNLPEIIVQAAGQQPFGVMIARGDLAVEIGFARLAEMQEEILWLCEAASVPVVWATQVLEEMVKSGLPTRGGMTDAAMSGWAECVMLNKVSVRRSTRWTACYAAWPSTRRKRPGTFGPRGAGERNRVAEDILWSAMLVV